MSLYHGSKHRFDSFRIPDDEGQLSGASNGFLGTWFIRESHLFVAEGSAGNDGFIAVVPEPDPACVHRMDVGELSRLHFDVDNSQVAQQFYAAVREEILATGKDWIEVVEGDGSAPMVICLRPELITEIAWRDMAAEKAVEPSF